MCKNFTLKAILSYYNSLFQIDTQKKNYKEDKLFKIINFCKEFNFTNIENNVIAMPNYENGIRTIILLFKKGYEHLGITFINKYQDIFGSSIYVFEISSWNTKKGFYTMFKFRE